MTKNTINEFVRQKLRRLRLKKRLKLRELAAFAGLPLSSYACMESGQYNISLEHLFRVLGALEADIGEVWPVETAVLEDTSSPLYRYRIQGFRIAEIMFLSEAEGAALLVLQGDKWKVLLEQRLSDFFLERLILYLEDGRRVSGGLWFERKYQGLVFLFFLKTPQCPDFVEAMIHRYLVIWSHLFNDFSENRGLL